MKETINAGILKEKEEIEQKLFKEISINFSISKKLAKKFIYETHLSLEDFKNQIKNEQLNNIEIKNNLDKKKIEKLYFAILGAKKIIEELSHKDLEKLKNIIDKKEYDSGKAHKILKKIFDKKLIDKAQNPQKISEHIMGASLGILSSTIIIGELLYSIGIGILNTPYDLYNLFNGKGEIENFKKV